MWGENSIGSRMNGCYFMHRPVQRKYDTNPYSIAHRHPKWKKCLGGIVLFQKKEVIYSETIGVCIVDDIVKLADNKKDTYNYYLLRSVFDKTKKAYIPVENHTVQLRSLITLQEALTLQDEEHYDEKSEQEKGEVLYVTERAQESRTHQP